MLAANGCGAPSKSGAAKAWLTDFEAARKEAAKRNVPILADFSGSDWCGWCIRLDREVFSKPAFKKFAKEKLVLFLADFPSRKEQPPALKAQNEKLATRYKIEGFPTVLLLDATGKELARTGYQAGGAEAYVKHLAKLIPKPPPATKTSSKEE